MKPSIQVLAACAMALGFSGSALAQSAPAQQQRQQHQQQRTTPAASQPAATQPPGHGAMSGMAHSSQQPGVSQEGCDCCRMMQEMQQMMHQMHQMHQMMQGHRPQSDAAPLGDEHQRHLAERRQ